MPVKSIISAHHSAKYVIRKITPCLTTGGEESYMTKIVIEIQEIC